MRTLFWLLVPLAIAACDSGGTDTQGSPLDAGDATTTSKSASTGGGNGGASASASTATGATGGASTTTASSPATTTTNATTSSAGGAATTSSSASGSGGAPPGCHFGDACQPGFYCDAIACGAGSCVSKPGLAQVGNDSAPVCGCDGVTYWNGDVAAYDGVAVMMSGACPNAMGVPCDGNTPCAAGQSCDRKGADANSCDTDQAGFCWGIPPECPLTDTEYRACTTMTCETACSLVASHNPYYDDGTCP